MHRFKNFLSNITLKKIIYLLYFIALLGGGSFILLLGMALGGGRGANILQLILGYFVGIGYAFYFSFPAFLTFITGFNFVQFLLSRFTNYWSKKPTWYNWFNFASVILTIIYAFLIIPYYLSNLGSVTYQVDYPVIFPQAIFLLVWIIYDWVGFFVKNLDKTKEFSKIFSFTKLGIIQITVVLLLLTVVFTTRFKVISNYFGVANEKILHLDYNGQVEKMWAIDNDNLLLLGQSYSNDKIFNGSRNTYLMVRNISNNSIVWAIPDKYIGDVYFDATNQKIYAVASQDYAEIKPENQTNLLVIEVKNGQISQTISLNNKNLTFVKGIFVNNKNEVIIVNSLSNITNNLFNLNTNTFFKDQNFENKRDLSNSIDKDFNTEIEQEESFLPKIEDNLISFFEQEENPPIGKEESLILSDRFGFSKNGKYVLNINYQSQPVQFSVIDLDTGQKILEYRKNLTSKVSYNNGYEITDKYIVTFNEQREAFEVFPSKGSPHYHTDYNQKIDFDLKTKIVTEDLDNISFKLASKNLSDNYGYVSSDGNWMARPDQSAMQVFKKENQEMTLVRTIKLESKYQGINKGYLFLPNTSTLVLASRYGQLHFFDLK